MESKYVELYGARYNMLWEKVSGDRICMSAFDRENGLRYVENDMGVFTFEVINEKKWLLAKIKYGFSEVPV